MPKKNKRKLVAREEFPKLPPLGADRYLNRELSWLQFNRRVLGEALETRHPLLERVKFMAIFSSNLDEFFMVRVAGIREQIDAGVIEPSPDGLSPQEQMAQIKPVVEQLTELQRRCWETDLLPQLRANGIMVCNYDELDPTHREAGRKLFYQEIFPVLTPLAFDPGHPFPHISNLSLSLAVVIADRHQGERFARVKVPEVLPRLMQLPANDGTQVFVWLEQLIAAHVGALFPGMPVAETYPFRVTRNGDVDLQEEEAADLLRTIEHGIRQRQFGRVVRLTVDQSMPQHVLDILMENMEVAPDDLYRVTGPLGLSQLMQLYNIDRPDLKDAPFVPHVPEVLEDAVDPFAAIHSGDILLHHPFDSFMPVVDLIQAAAEDPQVLAIKQTLYRVGRNTPLVEALIRARENGKQVTVLMELKARFDEENNIEWAKQLESVGVHVVYGLVGLKTHCKIALIVRKERDGIRRYVHLSTGNYNVATAHLYTDLGLLTVNPDFGADASDVFNYLTGYSAQRSYRQFLVAPVNARQALQGLIEREIQRHKEQGNGQLILKMNTLTDPQMIEALYTASKAGVQIDLIIRGVCCLRPGVPGISERIRVRSVIGRFLEHSRIYYFHNGGKREVYLGSADLMSRNLNRRVEVLFPVHQADLVQRLRDEILESYLHDTVNAHELRADGTYVRPSGDMPMCDTQVMLLKGAGKKSVRVG
ncbi:MAG: polyphosphate kinase 1 [Chloroflexota bacterium]|nr:polyphosphate kinase 1 [Chloroflexota bacterium]PLS77306.1 MAG: polyphosphate kinase 1 [Chloroflexota bacterium]